MKTCTRITLGSAAGQVPYTLAWAWTALGTQAPGESARPVPAVHGASCDGRLWTGLLSFLLPAGSVSRHSRRQNDCSSICPCTLCSEWRIPTRMHLHTSAACTLPPPSLHSPSTHLNSTSGAGISVTSVHSRAVATSRASCLLVRRLSHTDQPQYR